MKPYDLCIHFTLNHSRLSMIEHGTANVNMHTLIQLAMGLAIPVADLMRFGMMNTSINEP